MFQRKNVRQFKLPGWYNVAVALLLMSINPDPKGSALSF